MSHFAKKFLFVLTIASVAFTGCTKKPARPDPGATMMGPGGAGAGYDNGLNPVGVDTLGGMVSDADTTLAPRDGYYEDADVIRGLLEPVYFDFDQSGIKASERAKLEAAQQYLTANPQHRLLLEGHCDWRGTPEYNLGLGERRAGAARQFLQTAGVLATRVETASKGDLDATENGSAEAMAKDRRVEIIILKR